MVRGGPTPGKRALARSDHAVSDFVGTMLMVAVVVALGSVVALLVSSTLEEAAPSSVSLSMGATEPGDASLRLLHRNGGALPLSGLAVTLERNDTGAQPVPTSSWTTPDPFAWSPGERLSFPLSPAAAPDERLRVRVTRVDENVLVADLVVRAAATTLASSQTTMVAGFAPTPLLTDGVTTTRLTVRVTNPEGALAVASVTADFTNATVPYGSAPVLVDLNDQGRRGDLVGGDGVWTALVALPSGTPSGVYVASINATDSQGRVTSIPATLGTVAELAGTEAKPLSIGATFSTPTAENVTSFKLSGWNWDQLYPSRLDNDFVLIRILGDDGKSWSALILLEETGGVPGAKQMRIWGPLNETVYVPRNGTLLPLPGLNLNLLDPVASLQWVRSSGAAHPYALYQYSGVKGESRFVAAHFGQDQTTANDQLSLNTGIFSVDVTIK